jgi:hypothetical protein
METLARACGSTGLVLVVVCFAIALHPPVWLSAITLPAVTIAGSVLLLVDALHYENWRFVVLNVLIASLALLKVIMLMAI